MKKYFILFSSLCLLIVSLQACGKGSTRRGAPGPDDKVTSVTAVSLQMREVNEVVRIQGEFQASQAAQLKSDFNGKVQTLSVKEGDEIFIGQALLKADDERLPLILDGQRAELREAQAQLEYDQQLAGGPGVLEEEPGYYREEAEEDVEVPDFRESFLEGLERAQEGGYEEEEEYQEPAFGEETYEEEPYEEEPPPPPEDETPAERLARLRERAARARARLQRQRALRQRQQAAQRTPTAPAAPARPAPAQESRELMESRERLDQARIDRIRSDIALTEKQMESSTLLAPIDGFVSLVHTFEGALIKEGDPLIDIVNINPIELKTFVDKEEIDKINKQKKIQVRVPALGQGLFEGEITYIAAQLSPGGKEVEVRIQVPNPELRIKIGMQGEAELPVSDSSYEAPTAPRQAILFERGKAYVYRVQDQVAIKVPVRLGATLEEEDLIEIRKGLNKGDMIVLDGLQNLSEKEEFIRRPNGHGS